MKKDTPQAAQPTLDLKFKVVSKASSPGSWDC